MNYYDILGISREATAQEIKSAYRKLAMEHHPDRGGDESHFQKINQAYDTLGDANKRARYNEEIDIQTQFSGNFRSFEDINSVFGDLFGHQRGFSFDFGRARSFHGQTRAKNLDLNIKCKISLLDSYLGKELEASFMLPSGRKENVVITIPPGIENGSTLRFKGLGDDTYPQVERGNLNVTILVMEDLNFSRRNDDILSIIEIDALEAMIGCVKPVETIDGKLLNIQVRPGINHGGEYSAKGLGFKNPKTGRIGDFKIIVNINIREVKNEAIKKKLKDIKNELDNLSQ